MNKSSVGRGAVGGGGGWGVQSCFAYKVFFFKRGRCLGDTGAD